jgi:hypothetical protein
MARKATRVRLFLPGMVPGAPRRNALVLLGYLFAALVGASLLLGLL